MTRLAEVLALRRQGLNLLGGAAVLVVMLVPLIVLSVLHQDRYWLSVSFGALLAGLCDPGGGYADRVPRMAVFALGGALLTALGFGLGRGAWGLVVLAVFVITLLGGLTVKYGLHRFAAGALLNVWFLIALALPGAYHLDHIGTSAWAQALAWLTGSALTIACTCITSLARGRITQPQPAAGVLPGDVSPVELTRPVILFAVIRAVAVSTAAAIAFGLHLPNADWMPVATLVAMKPSLHDSALAAEQRLAGTILGAAAAALFLLAIDSRIALELIIIVLGALAGAIRAVSYALYTAAVAGAVLIAMDLPHPSSLADEARRILFTFAGVAIAVLVMLLAEQLRKHTTTTAPRSP